MASGFKKVADFASKIDPTIVGITATTATIENSLKYIKAIKKVLPNTLTIIGGPHVTFLPVETLKSEDSLDIVVIGEGEETIVEIAEKYKNDKMKNLSEIKGIFYRNNDKIKQNIQDL